MMRPMQCPTAETLRRISSNEMASLSRARSRTTLLTQIPPRSGQGFEARRDVDAVAEDVVLVDDDVAEIDADAEIDAPLGWHIGVARGHLALDLDRATNRIDHARELAEQTVARRVDYAAAVLLDLGVG